MRLEETRSPGQPRCGAGRSRALLVLAVLSVAACGGPAAGSPRVPPPPTPSTTTSPAAGPPLLAVEEGGPAGADLASSARDRVAIVRLSGYAAAKQPFRARGLPRIGNAAAVVPLESTIAGGRLYYADGAGVIRTLAAGGQVTVVTRVPLRSSQQVLSFAVSPDGSRLEAAVFGWPPVHDPPPQAPIDPPFGPGDYTLDLYSAAPGQATAAAVSHRSWPQSGRPPGDVLQLVGWSARGPLATVDTLLGTQQADLGRRIFGHVAELDGAGRPGPVLGGAACLAWSVLPDETVLCSNQSQTAASVRDRTGRLIFGVPSPTRTFFQALSLAPDARHVAYLGGVAASDGSSRELPATFVPEGWLDADTIVGLQQGTAASHLGLVRLADPQTVQDLGFEGFFVGPIQAPAA